METITIRAGAGMQVPGELHRQILDAFADAGELVFDFGESERIDFATAQLLMAAQAHARSTHTAIRLRNTNETVRGQLRLCRIIR